MGTPPRANHPPLNVTFLSKLRCLHSFSNSSSCTQDSCAQETKTLNYCTAVQLCFFLLYAIRLFLLPGGRRTPPSWGEGKVALNLHCTAALSAAKGRPGKKTTHSPLDRHQDHPLFSWAQYASRVWTPSPAASFRPHRGHCRPRNNSATVRADAVRSPTWKSKTKRYVREEEICGVSYVPPVVPHRVTVAGRLSR